MVRRMNNGGWAGLWASKDITSEEWSWDDYIRGRGYDPIPWEYIKDIVPNHLIPTYVRTHIAQWYGKNGFVLGYSMTVGHNKPGPTVKDGRSFHGYWFAMIHPDINKKWVFFTDLSRGKLVEMRSLIDAIADPKFIPLCMGIPEAGEMFGPTLKRGPNV